MTTTKAFADALDVDIANLTQDCEVAHSVAAVVGKKDATLEPKLDGWRYLAYVGENGTRTFTRSGNELTGILPKLEAMLADALPAGTWLDGEAVSDSRSTVQSILGGNGKPEREDEIQYVVFDLIGYDGIDARPLPLSGRRSLLKGIFEQNDFTDGEVVRAALALQLEATDENHAACVEAGFEGTVVKMLDRPYGSGKRDGAGFYKIKPQATIEALIMGFTDGDNGFAGLVGAIRFGQIDTAKGEVVERGTCSGFDLKLRKAMTDHPEQYIGRVIEVAHFGVQKPTTERPHGAFLSPQWKRFRDEEKSPLSVTLHDE